MTSPSDSDAAWTGMAAPAGPGVVTEADVASGVISSSASLLTRRAEYEGYVGPTRAHYYVPRFEAFDRGASAASWNWPAAFITQYWMLYRAMFLWGILGFPILSWLVSLTVNAAWSLATGTGLWTTYTQPYSTGYHWVLMLALYLASFTVMGLFSNKLYHRHVLKEITKSHRLGLTESQRRDWLIRQGATGGATAMVILLVFILACLALVGATVGFGMMAYGLQQPRPH